ncbi:ubiquinol-cytochrome c reductase iron-sulfur subunit [Oscillatoria acuminata]|uniref:Rieske Fe-S protein n=1 Tax=Oscillatoria acuminata PCC 6304 TaxID=56110 RepID=K9TNP8_9CYAN|nr:ubiquinol-cytochrome c reductase iron-sulfur subunit [Oscillatoria acuminata]AFY84175.1 Rieske Fe-S protein [Oscillatoria acuminata PCC 6304]
MKRREFLNWVGVGGVASFLPMAIAACTPSGESTTEVSTPPDNFEAVGTVFELETQGQILNENFQNGAISVTRNPEDSQLLYAVNPTCTHNRCLVDWNAAERKYICPCHGAEYSPDGTVIKGPAEENLPPYLVKIEGEQVVVQAI